MRVFWKSVLAAYWRVMLRPYCISLPSSLCCAQKHLHFQVIYLVLVGRRSLASFGGQTKTGEFDQFDPVDRIQIRNITYKQET